jgi:hypothetical protein
MSEPKKSLELDLKHHHAELVAQHRLVEKLASDPCQDYYAKKVMEQTAILFGFMIKRCEIDIWHCGENEFPQPLPLPAPREFVGLPQPAPATMAGARAEYGVLNGQLPLHSGRPGVASLPAPQHVDVRDGRPEVRQVPQAPPPEIRTVGQMGSSSYSPATPSMPPSAVPTVPVYMPQTQAPQSMVPTPASRPGGPPSAGARVGDKWEVPMARDGAGGTAEVKVVAVSPPPLVSPAGEVRVISTQPAMGGGEVVAVPPPLSPEVRIIAPPTSGEELQP